MVICTPYVHITMGHFKNKNIVLSGKSLVLFGVASLLKHTMSQLSTSAIYFCAEIQEKTSPWLYIQTGVYITMDSFVTMRRCNHETFLGVNIVPKWK